MCTVCRGVMLNVASLVNIVLAVGFSVDYAAHIAEAFCSCDVSALLEGSNGRAGVNVNVLRARTALGELGASVLKGGFSTFLVVITSWSYWI